MGWLFLLLGLIGVAAFVYLAAVALVLILSLKPVRIHQYVSPGFLGFAQEEAAFTSEDGVELFGWWSDGGGETVVISVHGYIMNRCEWVPVQTFLSPKGLSFLHFDLRAHGRSRGGRIGFGRAEKADVLAAIDWVKAKAPGRRIVLLGSSMGAVACVLAALERQEEISALILDGSYRSLDEAMVGWWPFLGGPFLAGFMRPSRFLAPWVLGFHPKEMRVDEPLRALRDVPTLLFYGGADPLIPPASVAVMKEAAGDRSRLEVFEGSTHGAGRLREPERFKRVVEQFLQDEGLLG